MSGDCRVCRVCGLDEYTEHSIDAKARCERLELLAWAIDASAFVEMVAGFQGHTVNGTDVKLAEQIARGAALIGLLEAERPRLACEQRVVVSVTPEGAGGPGAYAQPGDVIEVSYPGPPVSVRAPRFVRTLTDVKVPK